MHTFIKVGEIKGRKIKLLNPRTGVGSKMTPGFTVKACHDGEMEVTAMTFHENYSTGGRYLFMVNKQKNLW